MIECGHKFYLIQRPLLRNEAFEDEEFPARPHPKGATSCHGDSRIQVELHIHQGFEYLHQKVGRLNSWPTNFALGFHDEHVFVLAYLNLIR